MLNPELWSTGLTAMSVGMGIVFSFLIILVFAINIMTTVVGWLNKICPVAKTEVKTTKKAITDDSEVAIAIAMAAKGI